MPKMLISLLTVALLLTACTGSQGPAGPDGAQGTNGATGVAGPTGATGASGPAGATGPTGSQGTPGTTGANGAPGPQGAPGPTGNANVQMYTFAPNSLNARIDKYDAFYYVPGITQTQLESSVVLCYGELNGTWTPVPGPYASFIAMKIVITSLEIEVKRTDPTGTPIEEPGFNSFKVVIIPATKVTPLSLHGPDLSDYNAVKAYYHLGD
ncbi:hypothetical protein GCM10022631_41750 [Deinococcus rubellus]|uniref:hypothetical protein n=1 Tax=Deinococcus rubellus TaxID=1889240 RepID=UPI0028A6EAB9|nr:hypothetical protein [Deinococcus rubellus]